MPVPEIVRVAVVGAGAFGRNHVRVWRELEQAGAGVQLTGVVEPDPGTAARLAHETGVPVFSSLEEMLARGPLPQAASVVVPTSFHAAAACRLLEAGIDVLVEKPIASTLEEADRMLATAARHGRILQPGHLERFNPAVGAVRPLMHRPLFFEVHRLSVFTLRSLDVDVVLDLMIHDLDVVLSFVRAPVRELHAVGLPVLSPTVDIANVRIEFESGCVANFTASRVSTERVRKVRFFQPHQYVSLDYARQDVLLVDVAGQSSEASAKTDLAFLPAELRHPTPELGMRKLEVPAGEPLRRELESFLQAVRQRTQPEVTAEEGRAALALALDIRAAILAHQQRAGVSSEARRS